MRASVYMAALVAVAGFVAPMAARAEAGSVDWQKRMVKCKGQGAPDQNAANVAVARMGAERAAKLDAMRNILETLKGVQVTGSKTVADAVKDPGVSSKVQGVLRKFTVTDTRYFSDGGVEVDVEMSLDAVADLLVPAPEKPKAAEAAPAATPTPAAPSAVAVASATPAPASAKTGLVVDTLGLKVAPALAPRILDETGKEVYGSAETDKDKAKAGVAAYTKDIASAQKEPRVGAQPVTVKAIALAQGSASDVVISNDDAKKARDANLSAGNVVFVVP